MKKLFYYALRIMHYALSIALCALLFTGCGDSVTYKHLTHDEARQLLAKNPDAIILDVRTPEEYEKKHIPNAVLLPLDEIRKGNFKALPDKNQIILTYCWTGRRAQDAAQLLIDNGYKNVYEFGGLIDWTGKLEGSEIDTGYKHISQDDAREMLASDPAAILIDTRFPKDYEKRHIVGAVFVPLEAVIADNLPELPDKNAPIIAYCGDGNRARKTAKALVEKGYTNVYEMGGIIDWTGPVEGTDVESN